MTKRGALLFAALGIIWGIPYPLLRIAVAEVSPAFVVFIRVAIGALILLPFAIRSGDLRQALRRWPWVLAFAAVELIIAWYLLTEAEVHINSSLAGLLIAATPIFGAVLVLLLRIERRIAGLRIAGLLIGFAGVATLAGLDAAGGAPLRPVLQLFGVAFLYALGPIIAGRKLGDLSSMAVNVLAMTMTSVVYTPFAIATWPTKVPSGAVIAALIALGVVTTALAFAIFFALVKEVGPAPTTVITYVNQGVALLAGVVFLGEPLTTGILIGFPLILVGAFFATGGATNVKRWWAGRGTRRTHVPRQDGAAR
jgi:drug/metabolite transporter (DMT)-like permease